MHVGLKGGPLSPARTNQCTRRVPQHCPFLYHRITCRPQPAAPLLLHCSSFRCTPCSVDPTHSCVCGHHSAPATPVPTRMRLQLADVLTAARSVPSAWSVPFTAEKGQFVIVRMRASGTFKCEQSASQRAEEGGRGRVRRAVRGRRRCWRAQRGRRRRHRGRAARSEEALKSTKEHSEGALRRSTQKKRQGSLSGATYALVVGSSLHRGKGEAK